MEHLGLHTRQDFTHTKTKKTFDKTENHGKLRVYNISPTENTNK